MTWTALLLAASDRAQNLANALEPLEKRLSSHYSTIQRVSIFAIATFVSATIVVMSHKKRKIFTFVSRTIVDNNLKYPLISGIWFQ